MKLLLASIFLSLFTCKSSSIVKAGTLKEEKSKSMNTECPDDGKCYFNIKNNLSLQINEDTIGTLYPSFSDSESVVLEFEYEKNEDPNIADDGHQEFIYLELDKNMIEVDLKDSELQKVNLLFGRLCFCRGQSGYFKITEGHLKVIKTNSKDEFLLTLNFKTDEVPQIITNISEKFVLN